MGIIRIFSVPFKFIQTQPFEKYTFEIDKKKALLYIHYIHVHVNIRVWVQIVQYSTLCA